MCHQLGMGKGCEYIYCTFRLFWHCDNGGVLCGAVPLLLIQGCMQNHNNDTIKMNDTVLKKNIPLTLLKVLCVRGSW